MPKLGDEIVAALEDVSAGRQISVARKTTIRHAANMAEKEADNTTPAFMTLSVSGEAYLPNLVSAGESIAQSSGKAEYRPSPAGLYALWDPALAGNLVTVPPSSMWKLKKTAYGKHRPVAVSLQGYVSSSAALNTILNVAAWDSSGGFVEETYEYVQLSTTSRYVSLMGILTETERTDYYSTYFANVGASGGFSVASLRMGSL